MGFFLTPLLHCLLTLQFECAKTTYIVLHPYQNHLHCITSPTYLFSLTLCYNVIFLRSPWDVHAYRLDHRACIWHSPRLCFVFLLVRCWHGSFLTLPRLRPRPRRSTAYPCGVLLGLQGGCRSRSAKGMVHSTPAQEQLHADNTTLRPARSE